MTGSSISSGGVQPGPQLNPVVPDKARARQNNDSGKAVQNGGSKQLSNLAAGNSGRKRRVHYSSKKRVRAAAFFSGLLGLGGRQTKLGRFFRKISPFLAGGLVAAGALATATGLGAVVGVPLMIAGAALGCANSSRNMLDLYVEHNMRKENGEQGVKHYGWKMAANALGLVLSAAPAIGVAGQAFAAAHGVAGTIGSALAHATPSALVQGGNIASYAIAGAMTASNLVQGIKEVASPEMGRRDRAEKEIRVRSDNADFSYTDPISGAQIDQVDDFIDAVSSKAQAVNLTAPDNTLPISASPQHFQNLLTNMESKNVYNLAHLRMVSQLSESPDKYLKTPPGDAPAAKESPLLWQLKKDIAAKCTRNGKFNAKAYQAVMMSYKSVATDFWYEHEEECDTADDILRDMKNPIKNNRTLKGTFVDPADGAHVGIALDLTKDKPCVVVTAPGIAQSGSGNKTDRTGAYRMGLELKNQFAGRGRDNFNSFAAFAADVRQASKGIFAGDNFAVAGLCQGGGKAAFASAKLDVPGYTFDSRPLGSGTVDHLVTKDCDWKEVQARWQRNLVPVMSSGDPISGGRGLRGGAIGNQVSYPTNYMMDVPSRRDRSFGKVISGNAGSGHHVSSYKDVLNKVWHEGDKTRHRGDVQSQVRGNDMRGGNMPRVHSIDEIDLSNDNAPPGNNEQSVVDVIHD